MRRDTKADANQYAIVDALRRVGASVQHLHMVGGGCPDLLVGYRKVNYLMELKSEDGQLNLGQDIWHQHWRGGKVVTVRTVDEAIRAIGAREEYNDRNRKGREGRKEGKERGDFEITYAREYGLSVEELHQLGLFAIPCECGQEGCKGWTMVTRENSH